MVSHQLRRQLSQDLRRLVTGRMTNDEFDDVFHGRFYGADDRAVAEIAECGYGLYSSDLWGPYRLKGRYAVDKATRRLAARCVLFLRTNLEYEWPRWPYSSGALRLALAVAALGLPIGLPVGICFLLLPLSLAGCREVAFVWPIIAIWPLGALGLISFLFRIWYGAGEGWKRVRGRSPEWQAWIRDGDFDVWPFRRREDFYVSRLSDFLLGANAVA